MRSRVRISKVSRRISIEALVYLVLIAGAALVLLPLYWMVNDSLKSNAHVFDFPPAWLPHPAHWTNYPTTLTYLPFGTFLKNTLVIEVFVITGTTISSAMAAYSFARLRWPGRDVIFILLLSVLMLPAFATLVPTFILWQHLGAIDTFAPLIVPNWFGNAFFIFLLRQFFHGIPRELEDAARIDGAGFARVFITIILPLSKPALAVVIIFTFMGVWNDFLGPLIFLNSERNYTLALGLNLFLADYGGRWELLMAASTMLVLPMVVVFVVFQRSFVEGIALTGLKG